MSAHDELLARKQRRIDEVHRMDPRRTALLVIDMQRGFGVSYTVRPPVRVNASPSVGD